MSMMRERELKRLPDDLPVTVSQSGMIHRAVDEETCAPACERTSRVVHTDLETAQALGYGDSLCDHRACFGGDADE